VGKTEGKSQLEDLVLDGRIILKRNFKEYDVSMDFTDPARDRYKWWGDVFAHHQEHLTVFTVSGSIHPSNCRLVSWMSFNSSKTPAGSNLSEYYQIM
jgi:hypothetical protein